MTIILSLTLENGDSPAVEAKFMYLELTDNEVQDTDNRVVCLES